jgi:hypothetical protein
VTGRFLNVGGSPVSLGDSGPTITTVSETHLNQTNPHAYSSISGLQTGDLMLLVATGPYRISTAPAGWFILTEGGTGGSAMTVSVLGKFATSSADSVSASFTTSNASNWSSLVVLRGVSFAVGRSVQANISSTTALTFPALAFGAPGGGVVLTAAEAFMVVTGVATYTVSPTPTSTIVNALSTAGGRGQNIWRVPFSASYSATPSASDLKAGAVVHLG